MMLRDMVRRPLEQLLVILWLAGLFNMADRLSTHHLSFGLAVAALMAGILAIVILVHYRLPALLWLPVLLFLAALQIFLRLAGTSLSGLLFVQAVYALLCWRLMVLAERRQWLAQTVRWLAIKPAGEFGFDNIGMPSAVYVTFYSLLVISVAMQVEGSALLSGIGDHSVWLLLTLLCALVFFGFSGRVFAQVLHSYLVLGLAVAAVMELTSLIGLPMSLYTLGTGRYDGLFLVLVSLVMGASSHLMSIWKKTGAAEADTYRDIYVRSFAVTAIILALLAFWLQGLQLFGSASLSVRPLDVWVWLLAGSCLLWSNVRQRTPGIDLVALIFWVLALLALDYLVLHAGRPIDLRPAAGYPDQWLLLGVAGLIMALFSTRLKMRSRAAHYSAALAAAAAGCYAWTLLAGIFSFWIDPFGQGHFHLGLSLIFIAGPFLLFGDSASAQRIRGLTVPLFLLTALFSVLAVIERIDLLRLGTAVFAFGLLLTARRLLPHMNRRWPNFAIFPGYFGWIGLGLIYGCLWQGGPEWVREWPWLLAAAFYQLLLRKPLLDLPALLMLVLATLWAQCDFLIPGYSNGLASYDRVYPLLCFSLALWALAYGILSRWLLKFPKPAGVYCRSLLIAGALCGSLSLLWSLPLLAELGMAGSGYFPWLFLVLLLALFPLSPTKDVGLPIRDLGSSLLFTLTFLCFWEQSPVAMLPLWIGLLLIGFLLWTVASFLIPAFNRKWPAWAFYPRSWPWLGFLIVVFAFPLERGGAISLAAYFLSLSAYSVLMLRYSAGSVLVWLPAVSFTAAGLALSSATVEILGFWAVSKPNEPSAMAGFPVAFAINTLVWANLQLLLAKAAQWKGVPIAYKLQLQRQDLGKPFAFGAQSVMIAWLFVYALWFLSASSHFRYTPDLALRPDTLLIGGLLTPSLLHGLWHRFSEFLLHCLLASAFLVLGGGYLTYLSWLMPASLLPALGCLLLMISEALCSYYDGNNRLIIAKVLTGWTRFSLVFSILLVMISFFGSIEDALLPLLLITVLTAFQGLWMLRPVWVYIACVGFLIFLHIWPIWLFDGMDAKALLPWNALQLSVLVWLLSMGFTRIQSLRLDSSDKGKRLAIYRSVLSFWPLLNGLALIELMMHGLDAARQFYDEPSSPWLLLPWDPLAALGAGLIQLGIGMRHARRAPDSWRVYGLVVLLAALGCYIRLIVVGAAPLSLWDTSILIIFAYGLFFMQRLFPSKPLLHMAMLTPLAALLTVPFQLQSAEASATLLVTGLLYLLIRRYSRQRLPVYLALLAFNTGLYLWIPAFVKESHLVQIYVIPAALTILILLQLHRRELKPSVMMATRLAATSTIYACATLDVFLLPDLKIFVLALALSLAGILLGISLRIRAFLYAGMVFLLLNVFGQLFRFYPEEALGKAIILMTAGLAVLGTMIWFNLKRMQIMQRIDFIRNELESWD